MAQSVSALVRSAQQRAFGRGGNWSACQGAAETVTAAVDFEAGARPHLGYISTAETVESTPVVLPDMTRRSSRPADRRRTPVPDRAAPHRRAMLDPAPTRYASRYASRAAPRPASVTVCRQIPLISMSQEHRRTSTASAVGLRGRKAELQSVSLPKRRSMLVEIAATSDWTGKRAGKDD